MSFSTHGFLSPSVEQFRTSLRAVPAYGQWLNFAEGLNQLGLEMLRDYEVPNSDNQRFSISALFVRAHQSFQAALILAERGMLGDARVVLRSAVEGAIALNALANDASFLDQLKEAHCFTQRKIARLTLSNPDYKSHYTLEEIAQMETTIREVDAKDAARVAEGEKKLTDIVWADVAVKHCRDLYELLYRDLSSDGTHTNINSIHRYVEYDANWRFAGLKVGPQVMDMVNVLKAGCLMFLWAAPPFARASGRTSLEQRLQEQIQRFAELPNDEPQDARVRAS